MPIILMVDRKTKMRMAEVMPRKGTETNARLKEDI